MTFTTTLKAGAVATVLGLGGTAALAQAADYSDAKLDDFVTAALEVSQVTAQAQQDLQAAQTDAERQQITTQAQAEAQAHIEETDGITVEEYVSIGQALQNDQDLADRINLMVAERTKQD
ncbi:DUF4168 domain-containing protein [Chachezhania antarctica]|uniref:DUF4168 domain-containing protein n=1 Tax=Chachezhania antarctica TaxID=2340860 RepID=UPI000EB053BB|nr:DUF4168 domain-containing protein [Chachezhania antarctica]|tara:strand:+ start:3289 stop:3648 length:360 start_codon:yes stop_codon:yes gene_type:complete